MDNARATAPLAEPKSLAAARLTAPSRSDGGMLYCLRAAGRPPTPGSLLRGRGGPRFRRTGNFIIYEAATESSAGAPARGGPCPHGGNHV